MRKYRVRLTNQTVGTMQYCPLANCYQDAEARAEKWANSHPEHSKHGLWTASHAEVA